VPERRPTPSDDFAAPIEERLDAADPPGDVVPALARLLRKIRDRERAADGERNGYLGLSR
jgi:hypothetical protein